MFVKTGMFNQYMNNTILIMKYGIRATFASKKRNKQIPFI